MHPTWLAGKSIVLREFRPDDASALFKVYGDPDTTKHLSFEPKTADQAEAIVQAAIESASAEPRTEYMLAVTDPSTDELVGVGRLGLGEHQSGQIGFALRNDRWGHGEGVDTVRLLQRLAFEVLDLYRVWGARSPLNEASSRTMQAAGMIEEGTIRGHLFTRGAWRDSVVHSILSNEYFDDRAQCR
jgi:RimJ/RimL family protein N-acetyltransferase